MSALSINAIPALAADENTWTGAYGGISVGYEDADVSGSNGPTLDYYGVKNPYLNSVSAGASVGYNYQVPECGFVPGAEVSVDFGPQTRTTALTFHHAVTSAEVPYMIAIKARLGYAIGDFLPYIHAGPVVARTKFTVSALDGYQDGNTKTPLGGETGIGVNYRLTEHFFLSADYSHVWLPTESYLSTAGENFRSFDLNNLKFGVGYKF